MRPERAVLLGCASAVEVDHAVPCGAHLLGAKGLREVEEEARRALPAHFRHPAAARLEDLAARVTLLRAQEGHGWHHVLGLPLGSDLRRQHGRAHCGGAAGRESVDQDALAAALRGQRLGEAHHRRLGARVVGLPELAVKAVHRRDEQHAAVAGGAHVRPRRARHRERAADVHAVHERKVLWRHLVVRRVAQHAGVRHDDVDAAPPADRRRHNLLAVDHRVGVRQRRAARRLGRAHHRRRRVLVEVVHDDARAATREKLGVFAAEPAAGAGDDGDAAVVSRRRRHACVEVVAATIGDAISSEILLPQATLPLLRPLCDGRAARGAQARRRRADAATTSAATRGTRTTDHARRFPVACRRCRTQQPCQRLTDHRAPTAIVPARAFNKPSWPCHPLRSKEWSC